VSKIKRFQIHLIKDCDIRGRAARWYTYFYTKSAILVNFGRSWAKKYFITDWRFIAILVYFMAIWYFRGYLHYYISSHFGLLYPDKSGNPDYIEVKGLWPGFGIGYGGG
jgi:hypothetical protein